MYEVATRDPEDDPLVFSFNAAPNGMTIDTGTGSIRWTPLAGQDGSHGVEILVEDPFEGVVQQNYTLQVAAIAPGKPPIITSTAPRVAHVGHLYTYDVDAEDPDLEPLTHALTAAPDGAIMDESTGVIQWVPGDQQIGVRMFEATVVDPTGLSARQRFNVRVVDDNEPPRITSDPPTPAIATAAYRYDVVATDANGDAISYSLDEAPPGMTIDDLGRIAWTPEASDLGIQRVEVVAADPFGGTALQSIDLPVVADSHSPVVDIDLAGNPVRPGEQVWLTVSVADNAQLASVVTTVNGTPVVLDDHGRVLLRYDQPGDYEILVTATDASGNSAEASETLGIYAIGDATAPVASITSPAPGDVVTTFTDIVGTVDDDNLLFYTLEVGRVDDDSFVEIARGTDPVADDFLGSFDPTLLVNDTYIVRLTAVDESGNRAEEEREVSVAGELKLGDFNLSFSDLHVSLVGVPITLTRTYSSMHAGRTGDFGYGWQLDYRDTRLRTSVPPSGQEELGVFNPWTWGTRVFISLPGGQRAGFDFEPRPVRFFGATLYYLPQFKPLPGSYAELEVDAVPIVVKGGKFYDYASGGLPYNPADSMFGGSYRLTSRDGIMLDIDARSGQLHAVTDINDNVLTFRASGITSSLGPGVVFERDPAGRVTGVVDPAGRRIRYTYDAAGDLVSVTDREGNTTRFEYLSDPAHYLERVLNAEGKVGARVEYDDHGRLVRQFDALGNPIELQHDVSGNREIVLDPFGNPTTFEYDDRGYVVRRTDALGGVTRYEYDVNGNPLSVRDPMGHATAFDYDSRGNEIRRTDAEGHTWRMTYGSQGTRPLTHIDPLGNASRFRYDARGNLLAATDAAGVVTTYTRDSRGNALTMTDALGRTTHYDFDAAGNQTRQLDALDHPIDSTYDPSGHMLSTSTMVTLPGGTTLARNEFEYDSEGRLTTVTDAADYQLIYEYDSLGRRTASIDSLDYRTEYRYDIAGRRVETLFPDGTSVRHEYDDAGRRVATTNQAEHTTRFVYDSLGRLLETVYPDDTPHDLDDNPRERIEYDLSGRIKAEIDERGNRTEFEYDGLDRLVVTRNALGHETRRSYDATGRLVSEIDALGFTTLYVYNTVGRRVRTEFADGTSISRALDELGRLTALTDQAGNVTRYEYNERDAVAAVIDALGHRTEYEYDERGNPVLQRDALDRETLYEYDVLGRRTATVLPLEQVATIQYEGAERVAGKTDYNGDTVEYEYDELHRVLAHRYPDGSSVEFTYTPTGHRKTETDARGTTEYAYDPRGRPASRKDPDGVTIAYTYDATSNVKTVVVPSGTTSYTYDKLNRLASVVDPQNAETQYHYDAVGNLERTEFPNQVVETRQFDALHRITKIQYTGPTGPIARFEYELDSMGNRVSVTELDGRQVEYAYDEIYRLVGETMDPPGTEDSRDVRYTYDAVGNRLTRNDSAEGLTEYEYDDNDRLLLETLAGEETRYTYDSAGRVLSRSTSAETVFYEWDYEDHLAAADSDGDQVVDVRYRYNADGIRVSKIVEQDETRYLIDGNRPFAQVLEEYTPGGIIQASYVFGNDLVSRKSGTGKSFYMVDGLGSTRALADEDGGITDRYAYGAYGRLLEHLGASDNAFLFAGEQRDPHLGLDYLRARYLDPAIGRFYGQDPFAGDLLLPMSRHRFLYALDNPVNLVDPSGEFSGGVHGLMAAVSILGILSATACSSPPPILALGMSVRMPLQVYVFRGGADIAGWSDAQVNTVLREATTILEREFNTILQPGSFRRHYVGQVPAHPGSMWDHSFRVQDVGTPVAFFVGVIGSHSHSSGLSQRGHNAALVSRDAFPDVRVPGGTLAHELGHGVRLTHYEPGTETLLPADNLMHWQRGLRGGTSTKLYQQKAFRQNGTALGRFR